MSTFGAEQSQDPPAAALREHKTLTPPVDGDTLAAVDVGPFGELVCLWAAPDSAATGIVRAAVHTATRVRTTTLHGVRLPLRTAQPLPAGGLLLVGGPPAGTDHNAAVYDEQGRLMRTGSFGDDLARLAVTPAGHLWVARCDNGIGGPHPVTRFGPDFAVTRNVPVAEPISADSLNLDDETVWFCPAAGSPVVRIDDDGAALWANTVAEPRNLVAHGDRLALVGGQGAHRDRVTVGALADGEFQPTYSCRLTMPDGGEPPRAAPAFGRGPDLHVIVDAVWHRLDLGQLDRPARTRRRR